jgi:AraC-like DNA-binding protein
MPSAYFNLILRRYGTNETTLARLLAGTGLDAAGAGHLGPHDTIQLWQGIQQLRNLAEIAPPEWGLELGRALDAASHGTLGVAAASASTLADALSTLERFAHLRAPYFRLESETLPSVYRLRIDAEVQVEPPVWRGLVEVLLLSLQALIESALGRPMVAGCFDVGVPTPPYAARYAEFFHAPVEFGRPASAVAIPTRWLPLPCPFADGAQHRAAIERLELAERSLQGPRFLVAQVERILEGAGEEIPGLDRVASRLRLSRRTLVRRLEEVGTSFREITDQLRKRRATALLTDPQLTVTEVAYRVGYRDLANFGRAFRRWFGKSPRRYREEQRASNLSH